MTLDNGNRPERSGRAAIPSTPQGVNSAQLQLLWVLFSDANSRFNTLIEECAHLQDTVIGLTSDPALLDGIINACPAENRVRGFSRIVCCEPKQSEDYYRVPVRDRAFLSLWTLLGGLIVALDENQRTHEHAYRRTVEALLCGEHAADDQDCATTPWRDQPELPDVDHLFWYVQTRGYFLTEVFRHYTAQIEHAHEMVIQMLENQPGKLPTPILLRRWNSAMYGEFLSEYSRHVNWEAHRLKALSAAGTGSIVDGGDALTQDLSLTHTWTHQPTSMAQLFKVSLKADGASRGQRPARPSAHRFATIRSAYFYLEQPILLPLLYHECAHIAFSYEQPARLERGERRASAAGDAGASNDDDGWPKAPPTDAFMSAREDAVRSLRMAKFPDGRSTPRYENFWDHFTEEIWADALAIALGGRAYLVALTLQLIGLSGGDSFEHFDLESDTLHELGSLGSFSRRIYAEPHPQEEVGFFWEARLLIACSLLERTLPTLRHPADQEQCAQMAADGDPVAVWIVAVRTLLGGYQRSGAKAHDRAGLSARHEQLWRYRRQLNLWVHDTTMRYLRGPFAALVVRTPVSATYVLASARERDCLESLVRCYRLRHMPDYRTLPGGKERHLKLDAWSRLENLPADIRWLVSADVVAALRQGDEDLVGQGRPSHADAVLPQVRAQRIANWSIGYANWMRHDGGAAFRVALEASRLRLSLLDDLADQLERYPRAADRSPVAPLPCLAPPFESLAPDQCAAMADEGKTVARLRRRQITDTINPTDRREGSPGVSGWTRRRSPPSPSGPGANPAVEQAIDAVLARIDDIIDGAMERMSEAFRQSIDGFGEALVGTIALGVIRPDEIARARAAGIVSPYLASLASLESQWRSARQEQVREASRPVGQPYLRNTPTLSQAFAPLLGDYQFLAYSKGTTPVERDFHARSGTVPLREQFARQLLKPRMVLQVAGQELAAALREHRPRHWGRLFMIRFKHRWRWIELAKTLEQRPGGMKGYSLLTSSAWEDVLLFTWFQDEAAAWRAGREHLGLMPGVDSGMDIQSTFLPPDSCCAGIGSAPTPMPGTTWERRFFDWADASGLVERVYSRSGRYDYTVIWRQPSSGVGNDEDVLGICMRGLASIPRHVWEQVSSVISSYESLRWPPSEDRAAPQVARFDAVTHFAVKIRS